MVIIILEQIQIYYSTGTNDKVNTLCRLFKSFRKSGLRIQNYLFWTWILDPIFQVFRIRIR